MYRGLREISQPLDRFSKLDYSTTKRMPKLKNTFSESSRRDGSNAAIFGTATVFAIEISSFESRDKRGGNISRNLRKIRRLLVFCGVCVWFLSALPSFDGGLKRREMISTG
ncbi:unnamed protein product [Ectocarpus sp. 12 AP-2014]